MPETTEPTRPSRSQTTSRHIVSGYINHFFSILTSLEVYLFVISASLAVTVLVVFYRYSLQSFDLLQFHHRAIGGAVMEAQDSAQRSELFYLLLMLASFTFSAIFAATTALLHLLARQNLLFKTKVERTVITHAALLIIPCLIMTALHVSNSISLKILTGLTASSLLLIGGKLILSFLGPRNKVRSLCEYKLLVSLLFILSACYFGLASLLGNPPPLVGFHNIFLLLAATITIYITDIKGQHQKIAHLVQAALPLTLIPLALPVSCEIQYWLTKFHIVSQNIVYATIILSLCLFTVYQYLRNSATYSPGNSIGNFLFPIFLTTLIVFAYWKAEFTFDLGQDLLHPGNFLVPAQMFIGHGLLPFIEFWPDLGLQSTLPASLYIFIFGAQGLDGLSYHFLPHLVGGIGFYFLLCRFFSKQWAFMCSVLLPFAISPDWIASSPRFYFPNRVSYAVVAILCIGWVMESFTKRRLIALWLMALISFAWMPSTGKTVVQCLFVLLALRALQGSWKDLQTIIISFLTVFVPAFTLYLLLLFIYGFNPVESIQSLLAYNIAEKYVLSYPSIVNGGISGLALWYYGVCPLLLLGITGILLYRQLRGLRISPNQWILIALALFSIFAGLRALHRHSLIETYNPIFFIILAVLLPFAFIHNRHWCMAWTTMVFTISALLMPRPSGLAEALTTTPKSWSTTRPVRVIANDSRQIKPLTNFLRQHLGKDQSYLEFIHGHLLYVLSGHEIPPFHKFARVLSTEKAQELYLKQATDYLKNDRIPLIILDSPFWGSKVDNISTTMAIFRISEFINENYSPFAEVSGFTILKANNSDITLRPRAEGNITSVHFMEGQLFQASQAEYSIKKNILFLSSGTMDPQLVNLLAHAHHPVYLNKDRNYFLKLHMGGNITGQAQIYYSTDNTGYSEKMSSKIQLETSGEIKDYLIPLPKRQSDITLTGLRLDPPDNAEIYLEGLDLVEILPPTTVANAISTITQDYAMRKLPYVWANFDNNNRWQSGGVLFTDQTARTLKPQQEVSLPIPAKIDKIAGNYLNFRIQSPAGGKARLTYGDDPQNVLSFDLIASEQAQEYVIRISSQWKWMNEDISTISFVNDHNVTVQSFSIWQAD